MSFIDETQYSLKEEELQELNLRLEALVHERTSLLATANAELAAMNRKLEAEISERMKFETQVVTLNMDLERAIETRTWELNDAYRRLEESYLDLQQKESVLRIQNQRLQASENALLNSEIALHQSEEHYKLLFNSLVTGYAVHEMRYDHAGTPCDYVFLDMNPAFEEMTGLRKEEAVGRSVRNLLPGTEAYWIDLYARVVETGEPVKAENYSTAIGKHFEVVAFKTQEHQFAVLVSDITDRVLARIAMTEAMEQAEAASLSKTQFLANMSHEIRTPMNGIIGFTELALMTPLTDEQRDYLSTVKASAQSLLRVVNDILDYSKIEAGKVTLHHQPFELRETIDEVADLFSICARQKGLSIQVNTDGRIPKQLIGDPVRLKQVLSNLVGNAVKFTHQGGITIDVLLHHIDCCGTRLDFRVTDTGIGIKPADVQNLFQSFYQADNSHSRNYGGTGLGLVISKNLVEMMDGDIEAFSVPGKGSTFRFTVLFPAMAEHLSPVTGWSEPLQTELPQQEVRSILLVEDDEVSRRLGRTLLEKKGYHVTVACDGYEAVSQALEKNFDIVLMDINMPRLDGLNATRMIREKQRRHIPIIALTAQAISGDREKCMASGMDDYLSKPLCPADLQRVLNKYSS